MSDVSWVRAVDCPLLQPNAEQIDPLGQRLVQRLLELALYHQGSDELAKSLLEEMAASLRADQATIWEILPERKPLWSHLRRGGRLDQVPQLFLGEALDRAAGLSSAPAAGQPALLVACLSFTERHNRVLVVSRPRESFTRVELEYAVAAGHYLRLALERARAWDQSREKEERLGALVEIGRQLAQERETVPAEATNAFQREHIQHAIEKSGGHMGQAAEILGLHRPNLYRKMRMLGMDVK